MGYLRKAVGLCLVLLGLGITYAGHRLNLACRSLQQYRRTFGYQTPTPGLAPCVFEGPMWKGILIDSAIEHTDGAHNLVPLDVDGDGAVELVANSYRSDALMVYQPAQEGADAQEWARQVIDSSVGGGIPRHPACAFLKAFLRETLIGDYREGAHYTAIADLNGDGRADLVVAGDRRRCDVVWYEAPPHAGAGLCPWVKHVAYRNDAHRTYQVETGDIDGDGDPDIVFTTKTDNSLGWLENVHSNRTWPAVILDSSCIRCFYARVVDIDDDGKGEIVASEDDYPGRGGKLHLYKCRGDPRRAGNWTRHTIARFVPGCGISVFAILDMDGDGRHDIVAANHQGDVYVMRNPGPDRVFRLWDVYQVTRSCRDTGSDLREIDAGDLDLDGDLDLVVADEARDAVLWFENPGAAFCEGWREHLVDQSHVYLRWCHSVRLGDVDKDGDLDIAVAAAASNVFLLYLNQRAPAGDMPSISLGADLTAGMASRDGPDDER